MENLLLLLNKISQVSPLGVFNQEVIIVQNPGMQHWLNLAIAKERGISMNMRYALPAQYLWQLIRTLASNEEQLEQSPYSREVLTWRIYALLATDKVLNDSDFLSVTNYWQGEHSSALKRYQLSVQLADLFEQYLIFRPSWLDCWQQPNSQKLATDFIDNPSTDLQWQAKLWRLLIEEHPYNPVELLNNAVANIGEKLSLSPHCLPKRISFFAINTMPPIWLDFINALSEYIEINFFHLNPCFAYWGDIVSEKQALKKLSAWSAGIEDEHLFVGNPLLANLGQQGREFLSLLQNYSTVNVELFVKAGADDQHASEHDADCMLHQLQNDILNLHDATDKQAQEKPTQRIDNSITFSSCHSALREVQALHDYLLHQFNEASEQGLCLTPKDVLVMCPQIEQYAPYVNAVFTRGWQNLDDEVPPLPCSIADRSAKDSDPLVATFSDLLSLPDSRFQVSHLLSLIRQQAIANKFSIAIEDIDKISAWLAQAAIHWGLDQAHKQKILGESANNNFTWQQGLSRLLRGFAFADSDSVFQQQLVLANVEGQDALLLGQLMLFIEQLQQFTLQLRQARTAQAWQSFLLAQLEQLFARNVNLTANANTNNNLSNHHIDNALLVIETAIAHFVEYCQQANLQQPIELAIVTEYLNNHFSQGDPSRQFMVGQVTFCSMLPMRSIPFKIIAVLGLNDGEYPRQRQPLGFDLMAQSKPRLGDRSRRGDDRYLFLEAIISARQALYLSYQGRNIKNNNEKQPSLVLKELMDYLSQGYGWQFDTSKAWHNVRQMPMQPFSEENYLPAPDSEDKVLTEVTHGAIIKPSFDANWLTLAQNNEAAQKIAATPAMTDNVDFAHGQPHSDLSSNLSSNLSSTANNNTPLEINASQLIRFFQHPSKYFAQQVLNLYLQDNRIALDDVEPFAPDYLASYLLKEALLTACLSGQQGSQAAVQDVLQRANLSGQFPDLPNMDENYQQWLLDSEQLAQAIVKQTAENPELIDCQIAFSLANNQIINISAQLPVKTTASGVQLIFYRSSTAKAKDLFSLYLSALIVQQWQAQHITDKNYQDNPLSKVNSACGFYFNSKAQTVEQYVINHDKLQSTVAAQQLALLAECYLQGQQQPLLVNGDIAAQVFKQTRGKRVEMTSTGFAQLWLGTESNRGFADDAYLHYFWPQCPEILDHLAAIERLYQPLYHCLERIVIKDAGKGSQQ